MFIWLVDVSLGLGLGLCGREGWERTRRAFAAAVISGVRAQGARTAGPLEPPCVQTL